MSYIGTPPSNAFTSLLKQDFSTSATTGYTLDHAVNNANDIALFINFVRQEPTAGYAASGTSLVLTSATASSDDMYCVYLGQALQTVNPANASVGSSQLSPIAITGQTAEATIATDDTILIHDTSASALRKMTRANFVSGIGGTNTPAFEAYLSGDQTISGSVTKITFNTEVYDDGSGYDNSSNYRFTVPSGQGGTYKFYTTLNFDDNQNAEKIGWRQLYFYKNGASYAFFYNDQGTAKAISSNFGSGNITMVLNATDYVEVYAAIGQTGSANPKITGYSNGKRYSVFGGYKIIR